MNTNDLTLFIGTTPKKLKDIRPGLCVDEALNIIFKSEYADKHGDDKDYEYLPICYNEAGERFHGDYEQLVYPINIGE